MAVKLEGTIKRFIGLSTDAKPLSGEPFGREGIAETIPEGSSFLEVDTGRIYRWLRTAWGLYIPMDEQAMLLEAMLVELSRISRQIELATGIEAKSLV